MKTKKSKKNLKNQKIAKKHRKTKHNQRKKKKRGHLCTSPITALSSLLQPSHDGRDVSNPYVAPVAENFRKSLAAVPPQKRLNWVIERPRERCAVVELDNRPGGASPPGATATLGAAIVIRTRFKQGLRLCLPYPLRLGRNGGSTGQVLSTEQFLRRTQEETGHSLHGALRTQNKQRQRGLRSPTAQFSPLPPPPPPQKKNGTWVPRKNSHGRVHSKEGKFRETAITTRNASRRNPSTAGCSQAQDCLGASRPWRKTNKRRKAQNTTQLLTTPCAAMAMDGAKGVQHVGVQRDVHDTSIQRESSKLIARDAGSLCAGLTHHGTEHLASLSPQKKPKRDKPLQRTDPRGREDKTHGVISATFADQLSIRNHQVRTRMGANVKTRAPDTWPLHSSVSQDGISASPVTVLAIKSEDIHGGIARLRAKGRTRTCHPWSAAEWSRRCQRHCPVQSLTTPKGRRASKTRAPLRSPTVVSQRDGARMGRPRVRARLRGLRHEIGGWTPMFCDEPVVDN